MKVIDKSKIKVASILSGECFKYTEHGHHMIMIRTSEIDDDCVTCVNIENGNVVKLDLDILVTPCLGTAEIM